MNHNNIQLSSAITHWKTIINNNDYGKIVLELQEIIELFNKDGLDRLKTLVLAFSDCIINKNVSIVFNEIVKHMKGSRLLVSMLDNRTKATIGRLGSSLVVGCSLEGCLKEASEIVIICLNQQIKFNEFQPLNTVETITPCQIAMVAIEALDSTNNYEQIVTLMEETNWSIGEKDVNTKLFLMGKILDRLLPTSRGDINCCNLKHTIAIMNNLITRYHHDCNVSITKYGTHIDLSAVIKNIWFSTTRCVDQSCLADMKKMMKLANHHDIPLLPSLYREYQNLLAKESDFNNNKPTINMSTAQKEFHHLNDNLQKFPNINSNIYNLQNNGAHLDFVTQGSLANQVYKSESSGLQVQTTSFSNENVVVSNNPAYYTLKQDTISNRTNETFDFSKGALNVTSPSSSGYESIESKGINMSQNQPLSISQSETNMYPLNKSTSIINFMNIPGQSANPNSSRKYENICDPKMSDITLPANSMMPPQAVMQESGQYPLPREQYQYLEQYVPRRPDNYTEQWIDNQLPSRNQNHPYYPNNAQNRGNQLRKKSYFPGRNSNYYKAGIKKPLYNRLSKK